MSRFQYGHRRNTGEHPDAHKLLAAHRSSSALAPLPTPDLRSFDGPILSQGQAGSCVTFAGGRQLALYYRANGDSPNWLFPDPRLSYPLARLQQYAGQDPTTIPPLTDGGCEPALYLKAIQACGFILWSDAPEFTYPTDDATLNDPVVMAKLVNAKIPPEVMIRAFDQRDLQYATFQGDATKVTDWIDQCLTSRLAPTFGMVVDSAYEYNTGSVVTNIDLAHGLGNHDQCIVAKDSDGNYVIDGSWGIGVATAGRFAISPAVLNNPAVCFDFQIVQGAPIPEGT